MVRVNKSITITGESVINEGENEVQIAFMQANIPANGNMTSSRTIQNKEAFDRNKKDVLLDFQAFDDYVYSALSEMETDK